MKKIQRKYDKKISIPVLAQITVPINQSHGAAAHEIAQSDGDQIGGEEIAPGQSGQVCAGDCGQVSSVPFGQQANGYVVHIGYAVFKAGYNEQ